MLYVRIFSFLKEGTRNQRDSWTANLKHCTVHCSSLWQVLRQILSFEKAGWFHVSCSLWMATGSPSGLGHRLISARQPALHSLFNKFSVLLTGSVPRLCELLQVEKGSLGGRAEGFFGGERGYEIRNFLHKPQAVLSLTKRFWGWAPFQSACPLCYPAGSSGCCGWRMGGSSPPWALMRSCGSLLPLSWPVLTQNCTPKVRQGMTTPQPAALSGALALYTPWSTMRGGGWRALTLAAWGFSGWVQCLGFKSFLGCGFPQSNLLLVTVCSLLPGCTEDKWYL